jgi:uncharacterized YccA/Bax inhibitor family protein
MELRTSNPTLNDNALSGAHQSYGELMTIQGAVNKTFILLFLVTFSAWWAWTNPAQAMPLIFISAIIGMIIAFVTVFKKEWAPFTAPAYALCQGIVLGGISLAFESKYSGIAFQAIILTFGTLFCLLAAYKSGVIKATENFKLGVVAATGAICLIYVVDLILGLFHHHIPMITGNGVMGIGFSVIVVGIAALNLILDFDLIERSAQSGLAKYMEWYSAFALMVTLIWLYLEILRLLAKLNSRRD